MTASRPGSVPINKNAPLFFQVIYQVSLTFFKL
nr:MAG TPA: hypothetical protein [Caudoviricetes sp.]